MAAMDWRIRAHRRIWRQTGSQAAEALSNGGGSASVPAPTHTRAGYSPAPPSTHPLGVEQTDKRLPMRTEALAAGREPSVPSSLADLPGCGQL